MRPALLPAPMCRLALPWFPALDGRDGWWMEGPGRPSPSTLPPLPCWSREGGGSSCIYLVFIHFYLAAGKGMRARVLGKLTSIPHNPHPG